MKPPVIKKKKKSRFKQGRYVPINPDKVIGDVKDIVYRSSWELKLMIKLDQAPYVIKWGSEIFHVPYRSPKDNRPHRYFPDFVTVTRNSDGSHTTTMIEVKPKRETLPPEPRGKKKERYLFECTTYCVNQEKWKAARKFCANKGWNFVVLTEQELGI